MVKLTYDNKTGVITGSYPDIFPYQVEGDFIEITNDEFEDWRSNQETRKVDLKTLKLIEIPLPVPLPLPPVIDDMTINILQAIANQDERLAKLEGVK